MKQPRVLIVGAGFGGIELARKLNKSPFEVLLLDRNNYHMFQPLLYQVATGGLEPDSVAYPVRRIFRGNKNVKFRMAEVQSVEPEAKRVQTSIGPLEYDYLVIATGSTNNYFNFEPVKESLLTLKSVTEALDIRSYLMQSLEKALAGLSRKGTHQPVNIAIIGGGPAGIELAGALAEMRRYVLPKDFPEIDFEDMKISLFEAVPRLLAAMSEESSEASQKYLEKMGVQVHLNTRVKEYDGKKLFLEDGSVFESSLVIWTAGVKGAPIQGLTEGNMVGGNRISINAYNQVEPYTNIFAIGDVSSKQDEENPRGLPMLAQVAIQQGRLTAKNLRLLHEGKALIPFEYNNKGVMATIGRNKAVVDLPHFRFQGVFAWFVWMFIHLISLAGFRNKLVTLIDWAQNYFNYDRPLGLIIRKYQRKPKKKVPEAAG
ncbi:MAG: NAD(P)/FAD-dependent oxidoreductase [Saprospiraceae bacterium]